LRGCCAGIDRRDHGARPEAARRIATRSRRRSLLKRAFATNVPQSG
jgi:hypothetical protein